MYDDVVVQHHEQLIDVSVSQYGVKKGKYGIFVTCIMLERK